MSSLVPPLAAQVVELATSVYVGEAPVAALLILLILLVAKQASVNVRSARYARFSRCLDVGVQPLAIAAFAITAHEVARILG